MIETIAQYVAVDTAGVQRVHIRRTGVGPTLLMLHASPMSSLAMAPFMAALADRMTVIAMDTPGYGYSDAPAEQPADLGTYVQIVDALRRQLGLEQMAIYGTATGAQIGIEYAKAHPEQVSHLILDNAADFTEAEHDAVVGNYFPDLTPDPLGSHLVRTWTCARDMCLYFPWFDWREDARLPAGAIDANMVHYMVSEYLRAGAHYDWAYRCAFANERTARTQAVTVPTTILRWAGSILKPWTDRFDQTHWADNFRMWSCGPSREDRVAALAAIAAELSQADRDWAEAGGSGDWARTRTQAASVRESGLVPQYVKTPVGQLHALISDKPDSDQTPVLLIHKPGESARALMPLASVLAQSRTVVVMDLPGHGQSMPVLDAAQFFARLEACVGLLLEQYRWPDVELITDGLGFALVPEISRALGDSLSRVSVLNPPTEADRSARSWELPAPRADGGHLLDAWFYLRDCELFAPWHERHAGAALGGVPDLDPMRLSARLLDLYAAGSVRAELETQLRQRDGFAEVQSADIACDLLCLHHSSRSKSTDALVQSLSLPARSAESFAELAEQI